MSTPSAIGRLRLERRLGAGGFATVWLAHDPELDAPVAVKILAENYAEHADVRRRFTDEARLLRRVDSDHLVRVYDIGELPDGRPYFVMTFADGGTLADRLAATPPPWPVHSVLGVVDAIADGLAVLHRHGVVHRDVKPVNVLLRAAPEGGSRVLLGDLGIAKDLQWASGLTMPAGSSWYAAPEQAGYSEQIGPATDVHALAMTAAQLLGLQPPWPPTPLGSVLAAATHPDPRLRTSSAPAFAAELRDALAQLPTGMGPPTPPRHGTPVAPEFAPLDQAPLPVTPRPGTHPTPPHQTPPPPPAPATRPRRRLPPVAAAAGVVVLVAAGGTGWWATHRTQRITPVNGGVSVAVPASWTGTAGVGFPGGSDSDAGVRAGAGRKSISVAYDSTYTDPAAVLAQAVPGGCTPAGTRGVTVGPWRGTTTRYTGCADGVQVDEVALGTDGRNDWSAWIEVRSVNGDPDLAAVLGSLTVDPAV